MATESENPMFNIMFWSVFAVVGIMVLAPTLQQVFSALPSAQMLQAQSYYGIIDPRTLNATGVLKWLSLVEDPPYTPWISVSFFNDGPDKVNIGINRPDGSPIESGESLTVDLSGANRRIETIFYQCDTGETASVRAIGKY